MQIRCLRLDTEIGKFGIENVWAASFVAIFEISFPCIPMCLCIQIRVVLSEVEKRILRFPCQLIIQFNRF